MQAGPPRRRPARAVADAPIDQLLARLDELTKGWLLALLEHASLDEAPGILAADLPRDGPRVCEAVVRALAGDAELRRIEPDGQLELELLVSRTGELAGAHTPEASVRAVDALEAVIWSAMRSELRNADPELVAEVSERLSRIAGLRARRVGELACAAACHIQRLGELAWPAPATATRSGAAV